MVYPINIQSSIFWSMLFYECPGWEIILTLRKNIMPESKKRPGHHKYRKPADIPAAQRVKGRIFWAVLFGVFGLLIGLMAAGADYLIMAIAMVAGSVIGYFIGISMEKEK